MISKMLVKNVSIWLDDQFTPPVDLLMEDGHVARIGEHLDGAGASVIDGQGCRLLPGFVDLHMHGGEPGKEERETIETALAAAASGGFTHVVLMPDTDPVIDDETALSYVRSRCTEKNAVRLHVCAALTKGLQGTELAELARLKKEGAVAFGEAGPLSDAGVLRRAMDYSRMLHVPMFVEANDPAAAGEGMVHESAQGAWLGLPGIHPFAEWIGCAQLILAAEAFGGRIHIQGVSTEKTADMIAEAKKRQLPVSAECSYVHLILTEKSTASYAADAKVRPPLRGDRDVSALLSALTEGVIDCIVSDHTPLTREESDVPFEQAPFGAAGLETVLAALHTYLIETGKLSWKTLIEGLSVRPRRIVGLAEAKIAEGSPVDFTLFDPEQKWVVDPNTWQSKGKNSPFRGHELTGRVLGVFRSDLVAGPIVDAAGLHV